MKLSRDEVKHIAKLANLPLTADEEEKYSEQLSQILDYVDQLNSVDTQNIDPAFNVSGQSNVMSEDKIGTCLPQADVLANTSKKNNGFFVTKGVFDSE